MYLTVDRTQHKRDSVSLKTFNKKYPNLDKEGKKKGKRTKQKRHVGQREKKNGTYLFTNIHGKWQDV